MSYTIDEYYFDKENVRRIQDDDTFLYGLIDKYGHVVVPCIYQMIVTFDETSNLAPVEKNGKWGYIDRQGNEVLSCEYDRVSDYFFCNRAEVRKNGKSGFIDQYTNIVIDLKFDEVSCFCDNMATACKDGKYGIINVFGETLFSFTYDIIYILGNGIVVAGRKALWGFGSMKYCLYDYNGHQLTEFCYDAIGDRVLSNGKILFKKGTHRGYLDKNGNEFTTFG